MSKTLSPPVGESWREGFERAGSMPASANELAALATLSQPSPIKGEG